MFHLCDSGLRGNLGGFYNDSHLMHVLGNIINEY